MNTIKLDKETDELNDKVVIVDYIVPDCVVFCSFVWPI